MFAISDDGWCLLVVVMGRAAKVGAMGAKARVLALAAAIACAGIGGVVIAQHSPTCVSDLGANMPSAADAADYVVAHLSKPDDLTTCMNISEPDVADSVARIIADGGASAELRKISADGAEYEYGFTDKKLSGFRVVVVGVNKRTLRAPSSQPYWQVDVYSLSDRQVEQ